MPTLTNPTNQRPPFARIEQNRTLATGFFLARRTETA